LIGILPYCDERLDFAVGALDVAMILPQDDIAKIQTLLAIGATHRPGVADFLRSSERIIAFRGVLR
jgi:hypothetical protein